MFLRVPCDMEGVRNPPTRPVETSPTYFAALGKGTCKNATKDVGHDCRQAILSEAQ